MEKISMIIPAYNEEKTIENVVRIACQCKMAQEVIVISDGSTDNTEQRAKNAGAHVYQLSQNGGKGQAMLYGFQKTDADIIVFLDADLMGITVQHIESLIQPVLKDDCKMMVGLVDRGRFFTTWARFLPKISGERAITRDIIEAIPQKYMHGFMVEIAINKSCRSLRYKAGIIRLQGLSIRRKYQKVHFFRAVVQYLSMTAEILRAIITVKIV
ncbi:MAG: glycosyltransferase family 2 protein [Patescibacteria group bacterium]